jgi:multiple sugar transport system permease protein
MQAAMKRPSRKTKFKTGRIVIYFLLILGSLIAMLPFVWMILASFKTGAELRQIPPTFFPQEWTLDN